MFELKGSDVALWQRAWDEAAGPEFPWENILSDYTCVVDWPACQFWRSLLARYQDAKCVLSVRDPSSWYESTRKTIYEASKKLKQIEDPARQAHARMVYLHHLGRRIRRKIRGAQLRNCRSLNNTSKKSRDEVPAHRLLEFDVKEGWEPLCEFLSVEIPDEPFPSENNPEDFRAESQGETTATGRIVVLPEHIPTFSSCPQIHPLRILGCHASLC